MCGDAGRFDRSQDDLSQAWSMQLITLRQHRDELIDDAKAELRALKRVKDPTHIANGLNMHMEFGAALDLEKEALREQIRALVDDAVAKMQQCLKNPDSEISVMDDFLEKFSKH